MTPEISTRLAASPMPDTASMAGSRDAPPEKSPVPRRFGPVPAAGTPTFLDSNPSDPITPDPTHHLTVVAFATVPKRARSSAIVVDDARISTNQKITLPIAAHR